MFKAIHKMKVRKDRGFTLVELLIVVAIIGILAAIAIPQFGAYRRRGYNASANSDLRNLRTTQEAMFADFSDYGWTNDNNANEAPNIAYGGVIFLTSVTTTTSGQQISLSPNAFAYSEGSSSTGGTKSAEYMAATGHQNGDTVYGAESSQTTLFRKNATLSASGTITATTLKTDADTVTNVWTGNDTWTGWVSVQ